MTLRMEINLELDKLDLSEADTTEALGLAMEHIGEVSAQLVPVEEGTLVRSQRITVDAGEARIGYGTAYARRQHEELDYRHEHGQAKFLEQPMETEAGAALRIVAQRLQGSM